MVVAVRRLTRTAVCGLGRPTATCPSKLGRRCLTASGPVFRLGAACRACHSAYCPASRLTLRCPIASVNATSAPTACIARACISPTASCLCGAGLAGRVASGCAAI